MRFHTHLINFTISLLLPLGVYANNATPVGVAPLFEEEVVNTVTLVGSAIPRRITRISAQVDGMIVSLSVDRGSNVEKGDELFHLDDAIASFERQTASAQLALANAELEEAKRKYEETERLHRNGHIPQTTLDTAGTTVAIAEARRDQAEAQAGRAEQRLKQHSVTAPFSGVVVTKGAEVGQWIRSDSSVIELVETNPARIEIPVPEHLYPQIAKTATAEVRFESLPGRTFDARIGALVPRGLEQARTFPVWFEVDNEDGLIAPGMSARVNLPLQRQANSAYFVRSDALVRRADGTTLIWIVEQDSEGQVARSISVQVESASGEHSQVTGQGLDAGQLAVVRGNENLRPNQRVRIVNEITQAQ